MMERTQSLRSLVNSGGFGLEIGPSHAPIFPRAEGFNVETLDHVDEDGLRSKYTAMGVDTSKIEEVTYIFDGRPLHEIISRRGEYDYIFSSHVIEHIPDFIGYMKSCELLLKDDGIVAFAITDKRYTFDFLQPVSTTGQVLEAHYRGTGRHRPSAVYDFISNTVTLNGQSTWGSFDTGKLAFIHNPPVELAMGSFNLAILNDADYQDVHGWYFTPSSFRLILHDLSTLDLIDLHEIHMQEIGALEFHVALSRRRSEYQGDRMRLQMELLHEQVLSGMRVLAGENEKLAAVLKLL